MLGQLPPPTHYAAPRASKRAARRCSFFRSREREECLFAEGGFRESPPGRLQVRSLLFSRRAPHPPLTVGLAGEKFERRRHNGALCPCPRRARGNFARKYEYE